VTDKKKLELTANSFDRVLKLIKVIGIKSNEVENIEGICNFMLRFLKDEKN